MLDGVWIESGGGGRRPAVRGGRTGKDLAGDSILIDSTPKATSGTDLAGDTIDTLDRECNIATYDHTVYDNIL